MLGVISNAFATATKFTAPPMCLAINALAIFHPSCPSAPMGTAAYAANVPSVVPAAPTTKHGNNFADPRNTRRTSAVNNSIGTANGNKNPLIASYVAEDVGMIPALASANAASDDTNGAPPAFAPHGRRSAHSPNAAHAETAVHTPTGSFGAMSARATTPSRRRVGIFFAAGKEFDDERDEHDARAPERAREATGCASDVVEGIVARVVVAASLDTRRRAAANRDASRDVGRATGGVAGQGVRGRRRGVGDRGDAVRVQGGAREGAGGGGGEGQRVRRQG